MALLAALRRTTKVAGPTRGTLSSPLRVTVVLVVTPSDTSRKVVTFSVCLQGHAGTSGPWLRGHKIQPCLGEIDGTRCAAYNGRVGCHQRKTRVPSNGCHRPSGLFDLLLKGSCLQQKKKYTSECCCGEDSGCVHPRRGRETNIPQDTDISICVSHDHSRSTWNIHVPFKATGAKG